MTKSELERLERIAAQLMAGFIAASTKPAALCEKGLSSFSIRHAKELIKQLDALKIPE